MSEPVLLSHFVVGPHAFAARYLGFSQSLSQNRQDDSLTLSTHAVTNFYFPFPGGPKKKTWPDCFNRWNSDFCFERGIE